MRVSCPYQATALSNALKCSLGPVDQSTVVKVKIEITDEEKARLRNMEARPPLSEILNLHDFEVNFVRSKCRSAPRLIHSIVK